MIINQIMDQSNFEKYLSIFDLRDRLIFQLYYSTGARNSEVRKLKKSDINIEEKTVTILDSKKKRTFILPLDNRTVALLKEYLSSPINGESPYLFPGRAKGTCLTKDAILYLFKQYSCRMGIPNWEKMNPRQFRRRFARSWVRRGGSLTGLATILRHDRVSTSAIYVENIRFQDEGRAEFDLLMNGPDPH